MGSSRCGASKNTMVRRSASRSASREERSPALRGRKPSKQKRSVGRPGQRQGGQHRGGSGRGGDGEAGRHGPFNQPEARIRDGRACRRRSPSPGSCRTRTCVQQVSRLGCLVVLVIADDPAGHGDAEVLHEAVQPPGVLGGDDVRRREQLHAAAPRRRRRCRSASPPGRSCRGRRRRTAAATDAESARGNGGGVIAVGREDRGEEWGRAGFVVHRTSLLPPGRGPPSTAAKGSMGNVTQTPTRPPETGPARPGLRPGRPDGGAAARPGAAQHRPQP